MKKLKELMESLLEELNDIEEKMAATEDEKEVEKFVAEHEVKIKALDDTKVKLEKAISAMKSKKDATALAKSFSDLLQTDTLNVNLTGVDDPDPDPDPDAAKLAAEAIDYRKKNIAHEKVFHKYCQLGMKKISGVEYTELLKPTNPKFDNGADGVIAPRVWSDLLFGRKWAEAMDHKALPMQSDVDAQGGYLVPIDQKTFILETPTEEAHIMPRATIIKTKTGDITIPRLQQNDSNEYGGMAVDWTDEGDEKPETEAVFEQVSITTHELAAWTQVTHRLLSRAPMNLAKFLTNLGRATLYDAVDTALCTGTGTGQPLGIINTSGIRTVTRATAGTVSYADLVNLKYAVQPYHRARGSFLCEDGVMQALELTTDTQSRPLFTPSTANGIYNRLVGKPYVGSTRMPTIGKEGDVAFGDFKSYYIAMEEDVVIRRSDDHEFPKNTASFAFYLVIGGQLVFPRTWAILDDSTS